MRVAAIRFSGMCPVKVFLWRGPPAHGSPTQNLPDLHKPPLATVSGGDLPSVELTGNGVEACIACRLDFANDRYHVGRKLRRPRLRASCCIMQQMRLKQTVHCRAIAFGFGEPRLDAR